MNLPTASFAAAGVKVFAWVVACWVHEGLSSRPRLQWRSRAGRKEKVAGEMKVGWDTWKERRHEGREEVEIPRTRWASASWVPFMISCQSWDSAITAVGDASYRADCQSFCEFRTSWHVLAWDLPLKECLSMQLGCRGTTFYYSLSWLCRYTSNLSKNVKYLYVMLNFFHMKASYFHSGWLRHETFLISFYLFVLYIVRSVFASIVLIRYNQIR